jgi:hypothetical protein
MRKLTLAALNHILIQAGVLQVGTAAFAVRPVLYWLYEDGGTEYAIFD